MSPKQIATLKLALMLMVAFILFVLCAGLLYEPDPAKSEFIRYVGVRANLHLLSCGASFYMQEHNASDVNYFDIMEANYPFMQPLKSVFGEDYTSFDVNTDDTSVEIRVPDGNVVSLKFDPPNK
jgi:hypothetical protein